jgi:hypothetical protein
MSTLQLKDEFDEALKKGTNAEIDLDVVARSWLGVGEAL